MYCREYLIIIINATKAVGSGMDLAVPLLYQALVKCQYTIFVWINNLHTYLTLYQLNNSAMARKIYKLMQFYWPLTYSLAKLFFPVHYPTRDLQEG